MPGATETEFFERAAMLDAKVGVGKKDDAAEVARQGLEAMLKGEGDIVAGWKNKLQAAVVNMMMVEQRRKMAEPESAR